jgi:hypothetical protein
LLLRKVWVSPGLSGCDNFGIIWLLRSFKSVETFVASVGLRDVCLCQVVEEFLFAWDLKMDIAVVVLDHWNEIVVVKWCEAAVLVELEAKHCACQEGDCKGLFHYLSFCLFVYLLFSLNFARLLFPNQKFPEISRTNFF